jgi:hypothetical protein
VCRYRPEIGLSGHAAAILDRRLLPSGAMAAVLLHGQVAADAARAFAHVRHPARSHPAPKRVGPAQEINSQYAAFLAAFRRIEAFYVESLSQQSTGTVPVSATVTAPYAAGSPVMQVDNAAVFGPQGTFPTPLTATALVGTTPIGQFVLKGSSGNQLIVNVSLSSPIPLNVGTVLTANVPTSAASSAAMIFPSYISASTNQLAVKLVRYFNSLPFKLPRKFAFPHESQQTGAIQQLVFEEIAGSASTSLMQVLLAIPLPTTPDGDLQIYDAAVNTAVNWSRINLLDSVQQVFAGTLPVVPKNLSGGTAAASGSGATSGSGTTGGTSSSGGTSSGTP